MTIKMNERLLMTGAAGKLGQAQRVAVGLQRLPQKANCNTLRLTDRVDVGPARAGEEVMLADLADADAVLAMMQGVNAVVHLGGVPVEGPFGPILQANILGMYNLYEAARKCGTRRVVFASSNHVTGYYKQSETITADHPPRPDGMYGVSKAFGEDLSRFYFDRHGIETACVRIGSSFPEPVDRRMLASWLSYGDLYRLVTACLTTPMLGHTIVFGMSDNPVSWWDNARARHVGYRPQDSSERFREALFARTPTPDPTDPAAVFQGGGFVRMGPFD